MAVLRRYFRLEHGVLFAVVAVAIALKLTLTSGHLLPGYDGAYYWVQVRSLLTNGRLAFDDLPLVFWVQSLLAVLMGDIPLAVRISDALLPALAAVPVWVLYHDGHKKTWYVFPVLLMAVLLHPIQLYYFTGDFIKNASAVPLALLLGWWLTQHTAESNWRTVFGTAVTCIVIALTHFGVLLLCVSIIAVWLCAHALRDSPRLLVIRLGSLILLATLFVLLLLIFVPERFARLIGIFGDVSLLFTNPLGLLMYYGVPRVTRPDIVFACIAGQLGAVLLGLCAWRNRAHLSDNVRAVVSAFVLTAFVFSSPLVEHRNSASLDCSFVCSTPPCRDGVVAPHHRHHNTSCGLCTAIEHTGGFGGDLPTRCNAAGVATIRMARLSSDGEYRHHRTACSRCRAARH